MSSSSHKLPNEAEVVKKAVDGDDRAFTKLYNAYVDGIFRFILMRTSDRVTAEDLTSEVFKDAWLHLDDYQHRGHPFSSWLFQIARNTVIDHYRTRKEKAPLEAAADESGPVRVENQAVQSAEMDRILEAMHKLTELQQQVITLKIIEGYPTHEVAEIMNKNQGAIRALQMRGLRSLRRHLENADE